jgi:hypothetical protein
MPISHAEAQELHLLIAGFLGFAGDDAEATREAVRALEIAALVVSDTDPERWQERLDSQEICTVSEDDNDQELTFTREPMGRVRVDALDTDSHDSVRVILTPGSWDQVVNAME